MVIKEFSAINFRNYSEVFVQFFDRINLIYGSNGQGKTNLAEGIYFLHHLDSFRTHKSDQLIRSGEQQASIQGSVIRNDYEDKARIQINRKGRRVWLNEEPVKRLSSYVSSFYAILFNPDNLYGYRHYPSERRAFFDRFLSYFSPEYLQDLKQFKESHAQKNRLLKTGSLSSLPEWNYLFTKNACGIINKRRYIAEKINEKFSQIHYQLTQKPIDIYLQYKPSLSGDFEKDIATLENAVEIEARATHAVHGPHRDEFIMCQKQAKDDPENKTFSRDETFFSQGEYRISLLSLKLTLNAILKEELNSTPVIILDDLYSELDHHVRQNLSGYLNQTDNQIFVTTTEIPESIGLNNSRIMEIREGQVIS